MTYFDSSAVMRFVQGTVAQRSLLLERFKDSVVVTSVIAVAECRVKPVRERDETMLARYDLFFASTSLIVADVNGAIARIAADVRAAHGLKLPDAIHFGTAVVRQCRTLATSDQDFVRCDGLHGVKIVLMTAN